LSVLDSFTPCGPSTIAINAQDGGTSAPLLVDPADSPARPHLLIGGSNNGSVYVVNRDDGEMGEFNIACPDSPLVQSIGIGDGPIFGTPLFWNDAVYVAAAKGKLKSIPMAGGIFPSGPIATQSTETLGLEGATPVLSSNGTSNAILWLIDSSGASATPNSPAVLRAFDPNDLSKDLYNSATVTPRDTAGPAVKFTVPTVANGKVYVGTQSELDVYGLLP
jgi:hypothetical protein